MTDVVEVMARDDAAAKELCKWIGYSWEGYDERDISDRFPDWAPSGNMQGGRPALRKVTKRMLAAALAALNEAGYVVLPQSTLLDLLNSGRWEDDEDGLLKKMLSAAQPAPKSAATDDLRTLQDGAVAEQAADDPA